MGTLIDVAAKMAVSAEGKDFTVRGIAIQARNLACTVMSSQEEAADLDDLHRTVRGTHRTTEGAAS